MVYSSYPLPYGYAQSETYEVDLREQDWEWELDGRKRGVCRYRLRNIVGDKYVTPESSIYKGDGRQLPKSRD